MKLSVLMITYNHERFIAQAIESAVMQQTSFAYEVVVGEDCSTDNTRRIITDLQAAHPDKIRLLPTGERLGMHRNFVRTYEACRGEYVALLDGDDYWTSEEKLQRQVEFLDRHPECSMCFHKVLEIDEGGSTHQTRYLPTEKYQKEFSELEDILEGNFIPAPSVVYRNNVIREFPIWIFDYMLPDWIAHILYAQHGKIGYINETMAVFRRHGGGHWSARSREFKLSTAIKLYNHLNEYFDFKYDTFIQSKLSALLADLNRWELIGKIGEVVSNALPPGATVLVVSKGDDELLKLDGRRVAHFPQDDGGAYAGHHPASSGEAITHLEELRGRGAEYLLIPQTSLWWLAHYAEFSQHLDAEHERLRADECCIIYRLSDTN